MHPEKRRKNKQMLEQTLMPCPFCGRVDKLIIDETIPHHIHPIKQFRICCNAEGDNTGCGASCGYQMTKEKAIEVWNNRKP